MVEGREQLGLARKAGCALGIVHELVGQHLEGDVATESRVARAIHLAHAAGTEQRYDFVRAEAGT